MAFSGPVPPGFRDPDTKQMVDVETSCEIFRKLLGFPKEYVVSTSGSPNKSGNVACTHEYGLGYPYSRTWHYNNKNGTKTFFWNEAGPMTFIYSNGTPMYQNPPPHLGLPVYDSSERVRMDEKPAMPEHSNHRGIDFANAESQWTETSDAGGIQEMVADSIIHFYPPEWATQTTNSVLKMRMPSTWGTTFTFTDGMISRYPRDTPIPPKLNVLSTGQAYMGENGTEMAIKKSIVAARSQAFQKERARALRKSTKSAARDERAAAKRERREERARRKARQTQPATPERICCKCHLATPRPEEDATEISTAPEKGRGETNKKDKIDKTNKIGKKEEVDKKNSKRKKNLRRKLARRRHKDTSGLPTPPTSPEASTKKVKREKK